MDGMDDYGGVVQYVRVCVCDIRICGVTGVMWWRLLLSWTVYVVGTERTWLHMSIAFSFNPPHPHAPTVPHPVWFPVVMP